jgi:hypothetical protein
MINKIVLHDHTGQYHTITQNDAIIAVLKAIKAINPPYVSSPTINVLQRKYYALLTQYAHSLGYTKEDLHLAVKPILFNKLKEFPSYFIQQNLEPSIANLTVEGLQALLINMEDFFNNLEHNKL